jgi:hypothetical protein
VSFDLRCWDANGVLTFSSDMQTMRVTQHFLIGYGSPGSVLVSSLPSGLEGVAFTPAEPQLDNNVAPYTWVSDPGTPQAKLNWTGNRNGYYLTVLDVVELGGSTSFDGDS